MVAVLAMNGFLTHRQVYIPLKNETCSGFWIRKLRPAAASTKVNVKQMLHTLE